MKMSEFGFSFMEAAREKGREVWPLSWAPDEFDP